MRFWENNIIFRALGELILSDKKPVLIKEVGFLRNIDSSGETTKDFVARIDMVLATTEGGGNIQDWCALEMQAVYFSGMSMTNEFKIIERNPNKILFPNSIRRPDFRSSGPKRLMPQLQIKVPALRRWGKKMAVVIDLPFYSSLAPMKPVDHISNADIAWVVVDYRGPNNGLRISEIVLTTLESSVEGLTAGIPVSRDEFEDALRKTIIGKKGKAVRLS